MKERTLALQAAQETAEKANQAKSESLANTNHGLRAPLNGSLGYAQILRCDRSVSANGCQGLRIIEQCGNHLLG